MYKLLRAGIILSILFLSIHHVNGQGAQKIFNPIYQDYFDSLKQMDYPYTFPILGKKASKAGYDLPYAWGASVIYFTQRQEISINQTLIGFNGSDMVDLSNFIKFGPTIANTYAVTVRPDIWVLPFLNVYGIFGGGGTRTEITLIEPVGFQTKQNFNAKSAGFGGTLTGAFGPVWVAWDNNINYADIDVMVEPVPAFNSSLRIGHTIPSLRNPQRNLSVWGGTFFQSIQNDTQGSIPISQIFPGFGEGNFIDALRDWSDTLPPGQKLVVNQIINKLEDISNGIDPDNSTIDYKLDKKVSAPFNLIFGAQYQYSKNWMLRTELGVFGRRSQFLLNLNYRFAGFKKVKNQ